jgi:hypothetical protein
MSRSWTFLAFAALLACAVTPPPLAAQRATSRPGLWLGAGAGIGWARVTCDFCRTNRGHSLSGYAHAGGRISNHVLLGGEVAGWIRNANPGQDRPADEQLLAYSVVVYWYPTARYPYYLKGGVGLASYRIDDGENRLTSKALGPQIGAGWEAPIAAHFSVLPYVNVMFASMGADLKFNGSILLDHTSLALFQVGVGVARR